MKPTAQVNVMGEELENDPMANGGPTAISTATSSVDGILAESPSTGGVPISTIESCWKCNGGAHLSRDCPVWAAEKAAMYVDFTCSKCGIHGHYPDECYYFTMYEQEERPAGVLRLNAQPEN